MCSLKVSGDFKISPRSSVGRMLLPSYFACKLKVQINFQRRKRDSPEVMMQEISWPERKKNLNPSTFATQRWRDDWSVCSKRKKSKEKATVSDKISPKIIKYSTIQVCVSLQQRRRSSYRPESKRGAEAGSYNLNLTSFPYYHVLNFNISGLVGNKDGDESGVQSTKTAAVY